MAASDVYKRQNGEIPSSQPANNNGDIPSNTTTPNDEVHEDPLSTKVVKRAVKRRLTNREDVQAVIDELTSLLPKIDEGSSIELSLND